MCIIFFSFLSSFAVGSSLLLLADKAVENRILISQAGAISPLVRLLADGTQKGRAAAAGALQNVTGGRDKPGV